MRLVTYVGIVILSLFMVACSNDSKSSTSSTSATYIQVSSVATATGDIPAGYSLSITLNVETDGAMTDVPVVVSGVLSSDENNSVYFDATNITSLTVGSHEYSIDVRVPRDIDLGDYTLIVTVDPDDLFGSWDDDTQFSESVSSVTILEHGPDDVIVTGGVDGEDSEDVNAAPALSPSSSAASISIDATDQNISVNATLSFYPNLTDLNQTDVNVTACVHIGNDCIDLPLWSSEGNGTLSNILSLYDLEYGYETLVAVDTVVPYTTVEAIVNKVVEQLQNNPLNAPILETTLDVTLYYNGQQKLYPIGLNFVPSTVLLTSLRSPAPQRTPALAPGSCKQQLLDYSKVFKRYKYGKRFGAGAYLKGSSGLDGDGLHAKVYASLKAKALGRKDNFMRLHFSSDALPGSFEGTGYDLDVEVLGVTVYSKSKSLSDVSGLSTPTVTSAEKAAINAKIASGDTNLSKAALIKQKVYKKAKKNISTYSGSGSTAIGYTKEWSIGKKRGYTQQFIVGIVPVKITAGAEATVGYIADIHLSGITSLTGSFKPKASIGAYVQGGIGVIGYSAGVEADLWLINESLKNSVTASLDMVEDTAGEYVVSLDGNLHEHVYNYFRGPNGKLYLYAEYTVPKYCRSFGARYICGVKHKTKRKYLGKWRTSSSKSVILDKEQTLFTIPLDDCN
jgi:hypothetical protein